MNKLLKPIVNILDKITSPIADRITNPLIQKYIGLAVRHTMTAGGLWLVEHGYATNEAVEQFLPGAVLFVSGLVWSAYQKSQQEKEVAVAILAHPDTTKRQVEALAREDAAPRASIPDTMSIRTALA